MSADFIKFDPEKILEVSVRLEQQHKKLIQCTAAIKRKSESLLGSWKSDSSAIYIEKTKEVDTQSETAAEILLALSQDLASASGIYKAGEGSAKKEAESLPTSGVFNT